METTKKETVSNYDLQVDIGRKIFMEYDQAVLMLNQNAAGYKKPFMFL